MLEDRWSWKRFGLMMLMLAETAALAAGLFLLHDSPFGSFLLAAESGLVFAVLFLLSLERNRVEQGPFQERANNYGRITAAYTFVCLLTVLFSFLPSYARPVMFLPMVLTMAATPFLGLLAGCYSSILLVCIGDGNLGLLCCDLLLSICGSVIARDLQREKKEQGHPFMWTGFLIFTGNLCLSVAFSLLEGGTLDKMVFLYSALSSALTAAAAFLLFQLWNDRIANSRERRLSLIIGDSYSLVQAMKDFSQADYAHARKVSEIARECARKLNADEYLAAAAGFYYRIGRLEGEPYVENGVAIAAKRKFPPELIRILGEYNGEKLLPSTVESAVVHIVDQVVAKFDVLDKNALSSSWNQDIVVYQTLNENSAKGLYDKSGLSMNLFLIARDYLIKEAKLYEDGNGAKEPV